MIPHRKAFPPRKAIAILAAAGALVLAAPLAGPASAADLDSGYGWHHPGYGPAPDRYGYRHHRHARHRVEAAVYADVPDDDPLDFSPAPPRPDLAIHRDLPRALGIIYNVPGERRAYSPAPSTSPWRTSWREPVIRANY